MPETSIIESQPLVSVIMAAYNAEKYLVAAVESILSQTYTQWELIIADDGSTDTTRSIIAEYTQKDHRIKSFKLKEKSGQAIARNKAIELSQGKYLAILDADDVALPNRLEKQVAFLETHTDIALVGSCVDLIDATGKNIGTKGKPEFDYEIKFPLLLQTQFIHSTVMIRKEVFIQLGGYDNNYLYAEDYDLWSRAADAGYKLANIQEKLVEYRIQPQSVTQMSSTQPIQERHALEVNMRNIQKYISITQPNLERVIKLVNNRAQDFFTTLTALKIYKKILDAYINFLSQSNTYNQKQEIEYIKKLYKEKKAHAFKIGLKRMFGLMS